jgi:hypothetical protein
MARLMKKWRKLAAVAASSALLAGVGGCSSMGVGIGVGGSSGAVSGGVFTSRGGGVSVGAGVGRRF